MLFNCIILALSVSIDSLGIGISYGIKHTKILKKANIILFIISFFMTALSILAGHYISQIFSENVSTFIGSIFLIAIGFYGMYKNFLENPTNYDLDNSNIIDKKEAIFLGLALSIDSICVGLGSGIIGINDIFLPLFVSFFQLIFINCGNKFSCKIISKFKFSEKNLSFISSAVLILLGLVKILF